MYSTAIQWELKFGATTQLVTHSLGDPMSPGSGPSAQIRKFTPKTSFSFILKTLWSAYFKFNS